VSAPVAGALAVSCGTQGLHRKKGGGGGLVLGKGGDSLGRAVTYEVCTLIILQRNEKNGSANDVQWAEKIGRNRKTAYGLVIPGQYIKKTRTYAGEAGGKRAAATQLAEIKQEGGVVLREKKEAIFVPGRQGQPTN